MKTAKAKRRAKRLAKRANKKRRTPTPDDVGEYYRVEVQCACNGENCNEWYWADNQLYPCNGWADHFMEQYKRQAPECNFRVIGPSS